MSKTQNELAKERKYKSLLYPITIEELERAGVDEFYVAVGTKENHVYTKWSLNSDGDDGQAFWFLWVQHSTLVKDGQITKENSDPVGANTGLTVETLEEALDQGKYLTQFAYENNSLNDASFDYIGLAMDSVETKEDQTSVYYPIAEVYYIATLRCKEAALDKKAYALRFVMDYYQEMQKLLLPEELDFDLEHEISKAKYELEGDY